jgi:hypothetical protein
MVQRYFEDAKVVNLDDNCIYSTDHIRLFAALRCLLHCKRLRELRLPRIDPDQEQPSPISTTTMRDVLVRVIGANSATFEVLKLREIDESSLYSMHVVAALATCPQLASFVTHYRNSAKPAAAAAFNVALQAISSSCRNVTSLSVPAGTSSAANRRSLVNTCINAQATALCPTPRSRASCQQVRVCTRDTSVRWLAYFTVRACLAWTLGWPLQRLSWVRPSDARITQMAACTALEQLALTFTAGFVREARALAQCLPKLVRLRSLVAAVGLAGTAGRRTSAGMAAARIAHGADV